MRVWAPPQVLQGRADEAVSRHLLTVLRLRPGDEVHLLCGDGFEYRVRLTGTQGRQALLEVLERRELHSEAPAPVTLYVGALKGDGLDHVVQQATELGVTRLVPMETERSIVRLPFQRHARWVKIAQEAAALAGRGRVPEISTGLRFAEAVREAGRAVLFWELADAEVAVGTPLNVLVGPEGGFSPAEATLAMTHGITVGSLGPR
ncbi:MAG: RsmE family RNA methyltransferase, partial [Candidatus Xenobia bacterium]